MITLFQNNNNINNNNNIKHSYFIQYSHLYTYKKINHLITSEIIFFAFHLKKQMPFFKTMNVSNAFCIVHIVSFAMYLCNHS